MILTDWVLLILCAISVGSSIIGIKLETEFMGKVFFGLIILLWAFILVFHFSGIVGFGS